MQGQIGSVVLVAVGVIILILALRGNLSGLASSAKAVGNSTPTKTGPANEQPNVQPYPSLAPGTPGSGITFQ